MFLRLLLGIGLAFSLTIAKANDNILDADNAIRQGAQLSDYQSFSSHPLYPYLQYRYYAINIDQIPTASLVEFLQNNPHAPFSNWLAQKLYPKWLASGNFQDIINSYQYSFADEDIECDYRRALLTQGNINAAFEDTQNLWLNTSADSSCAPLFAAMLEQHAVNKAEIAARFSELMQARKFSAARDMQSYLSGDDSNAANVWLQIRQNLLAPQSVLTIQSEPWLSLASADILYQMAAKSPDDAALLALQAKQQGAFNQQQEAVGKGLSRVAAKLAQSDDPQATAIFLLIPPGGHDRNAVFDMIAYWLRNNSRNLIAEILVKSLSQEELQTPEYQYWIAKSFEFDGNSEMAKTYYEKAASHRDLFGFLAAEKLGLPYNYNDHPIVENHLLYQNIEAMPEAYRLKTFLRLGQPARAGLELSAMTRHMNKEELQQTALFASRNGMAVRAVMILAEAKDWDALSIRFPTEYTQKVMELSREVGTSPANIFAIIRKESVFQPAIKSPAGAIGLMQIMPRTAQHIAKQYDINYRGEYQLIDPDTNLQLGSLYLRDKISQFGHLAYAAAAYNAGESRVNRWQTIYPDLPLDEWIAQIPFYETRDYAKRVLEYKKVYEYRLGIPSETFADSHINP